MAGSARTMAGTGLIALLALGGFAGCDSTQNKNERAKLRATRELASRELQRAGRPNPDVHVTRVTRVRGKRSTAIVVDLRSSADEPLTDVPITVGVRTSGGRRLPINARKNLDWFQTHVPAIAAGGNATWVFERTRPVPAGRPFARVGVPDSPSISHSSSLPQIEATAAGESGRAARVLVSNSSDVPQYGLQVYALVSRGGRYVAAGKTEIAHLGTGQRTTARVPLIGSARTRPARVHAVPTTFQ